MDSTSGQALGRIALDAALAGARVLDRYGRGSFSVRTKMSPRDLVTDADQAAEEAVLGHVRRHRGQDAILAEESGAHPGRSGIRWIVDPLDGTTNFVHGRPDYAVALAAEASPAGTEGSGPAGAEDDAAGQGTAADAAGQGTAGQRADHGAGRGVDRGVDRGIGRGPGLDTVAGAIVRPAFGDWIACGDSGIEGSAGTPAVSATRRLDEALVSVGVSLHPARRALTFALLEKVYGEVRDFRRTGSASCELFAVATGALDAYVGIDTRPWDIAPGWAVVRAAGGRCLAFPTASGHTAYVVGTPAVVDLLVPLVEQNA